jgi:hypothetical protein
LKAGRLSEAFGRGWGDSAKKLTGLMYHVERLHSAAKEATMKQNLINLRQRVMEASMEVTRAQRAYLDAAGKSQSELKEAAKKYLKATEPYDAALQELRQFLLAAETSEFIAVELEHTERLIDAIDKEKKVGSKLIKRHVEMNAENVKPTSRRTEEE